MVRNIPNKYTQDMLLELFEKNHKKKFDFFYLPIDYNVIFYLFRITATLDTLSWTSFTPNLLEIFTRNSIKENGTSSIQSKFVRSVTPVFRAQLNWNTTSNTPMLSSSEKKGSGLSLVSGHSRRTLVLSSKNKRTNTLPKAISPEW